MMHEAPPRCALTLPVRLRETSPSPVCGARLMGVGYTHPPHTPAGSTPAGDAPRHSTPQALLPADLIKKKLATNKAVMCLQILEVVGSTVRERHNVIEFTNGIHTLVLDKRMRELRPGRGG